MDEIEKCKYCSPIKIDDYGNGTGTFIKGIGSCGGMWIYITNGIYILRSNSSNGYNEFKPVYCPMCGKRLINL